MNRVPSCFLAMILCCLAGCSSLFNPDKSIATAISNYFPDSQDASPEMESRLAEVVEASSDPSAQPGSPTASSTLPPMADRGTTVSSNVNLSSAKNQGDSSWDKIERSLAVDKVKNIEPPPQMQRIPQGQPTQDELIRIYDQINRLPPDYQPLPPLIQRPVIYDHSIVKGRWQSLDIAAGGQSSKMRSDISWKDSLEATIAHLEEELNSMGDDSPDAQKLKKSLKILNSVDTDKGFVELVDKLETLKAKLPAQQFAAIRDVIEATDGNKSDLISQLKGAVEQVSQSAELSIRNATFCMAVDGFGKFEKFLADEFRAGDEVLMYCELENFAEEQIDGDQKVIGTGQSKAGKQNHGSPANRCRFDAQIEFLDNNDETVFIKSFANISDESQSKRDDFYLFFRFKIPSLPPGAHKVQLRLKDKIGRKTATLTSPVQFKVTR